MARRAWTQLYQPLLFRVIHASSGLATLAAILTAYWTYETYDGRWGRIGLPDWPAIEGIHGTFGLWSLLLLPILTVYSVHRGARRLVQPDTIAKLGQIPTPIGWYTVHRITNTFMLLALAFGVFSGKMMSEKWLPAGELTHAWYTAHLLSWVIMVVAFAFHLLMTAKVGGVPLLLSAWRWHRRPADHLSVWRSHLRAWQPHWRHHLWQSWRSRSLPLKVVEVIVLGSVILAWGGSLVKELSR
ncbi:MAG: cytochrome b/b6 domain-containing protein [Spirulinaceae cyanobacterium]